MEQLRARRLALLCGLLLWSAHVAALNIVLTNDDGFETANIQALHRALVDAGHEVIMSAPYSGQSGTSGQVAFMRPIRPTSAPSPGGARPAGAPGVGNTGLAPNQHYVDGSPAAALLYGIDVLAKRRWGQPPDLVISGPNEGNNLGVVTPHSGTVGATVTALNKGIPAIAVSAESGDALAAPVVAAVTVRLIEALDGKRGIGLPAGVGLNVNLPAIDADGPSAAEFRFVLTQIGSSSAFGLQFYERLGDSETAVSLGIPSGLPMPGVSIAVPASAAGYALDKASDSESNALAPLTVTVSPIQGTYAADARARRAVRGELRSLFRRKR